jgi:FSR family fosmidomycin resistance protein-like MFS transporter
MAAAVSVAPGLARRILPLTLGHAAVDFTQGAVPALIPYLHDAFHLSYTADALIFFAMTVSSSVTQPIFGHFADRGEQRLLLPAAVLVAGLGLAGCALAPHYALALVATFVAGLGVAAYHPEASRRTSELAGGQRATGMAFFSVGGNIGFAAGPALAGLVAAQIGLHGGFLLAIPALAVASLLATRTLAGAAGRARAAAAAKSGADDLRSLGILLGALGLRGYVYFGLLAFIPLFEQHARHRSAGYGAVLLTLMLLGGALMTIAAGPVADRFGPRTTMLLLSAPVGPLVAVYVLTASVLGAACVILAGASVVGTFALSIVLSQQYLPSRGALAAGLSIGFSMGVGGALTVAMGRIADSLGLTTAFSTLTVVAVVGACIVAALPGDRQRRAA